MLTIRWGPPHPLIHRRVERSLLPPSTARASETKDRIPPASEKGGVHCYALKSPACRRHRCGGGTRLFLLAEARINSASTFPDWILRIQHDLLVKAAKPMKSPRTTYLPRVMLTVQIFLRVCRRETFSPSTYGCSHAHSGRESCRFRAEPSFIHWSSPQELSPPAAW